MTMRQIIGPLSGDEGLKFPPVDCKKTEESMVCPDCGKEVSVLRITYDGKTSNIIPTCSCVVEKEERLRKEMAEKERKERIECLYSAWQLGRRFENCTFENFTIRPGVNNAFELTKRYANNFPPEDGIGLLLLGQSGCGKTHLAVAIMHEVKKKGFSTVFASVPEIMSRFRATFERHAEEAEEQLMYGLRNADLVILDDLVAEKKTEWKQEKIYEIVDARYRAQLPIVITTNATMDELKEQVGTRTHDRLLEMCYPIFNKGTSYRQEKREEN